MTKKQQLAKIEKIKKEYVRTYFPIKNFTLQDTLIFFQKTYKKQKRNYFQRLPLEILHLIYFYSLTKNVLEFYERKWELLLAESIEKDEEFVMKWLLQCISKDKDKDFYWSTIVSKALVKKNAIRYIVWCYEHGVAVNNMFADTFYDKNYQMQQLIRKKIRCYV